jgi:2-oxoisovalerate dehydrogenase E1 component
VVGSRNWITPAPECEEYFFPQAEWIVDTIHERIVPLKDHRCATVQTNLDLLRRNRLGV